MLPMPRPARRQVPVILRRRFAFVAAWLLVGLCALLIHAGPGMGILLGAVVVSSWIGSMAWPPLRESPPRSQTTTFRLLLGLFALDIAFLLSYDLFLPAGISAALGLIAWRPIPRQPTES